MNTKPTQEILDKYLRKICEDRAFEKSPRNVRLLKFLVEKAYEQGDVNEYVVGLELFEQNYNPESNDSKVRVYMFNLRKKLEEYYNANGKNDELKFILKKGQYNLEFEHSINLETRKEKRFKKPFWFASKLSILHRVLIAAAVILILVLSNFVRNAADQPQYCWESFFEENTDNICIMADQVICYQTIDGVRIPTIIFGINSENDFISYLDKHNEDSVTLADYTLFSKMAPYVIKTLTGWFRDNKSDFSLRVESRFEADEMRDNNILYVGQFKTMNATKAIFLKNSTVFKTEPKLNGFITTKDGKQTLYEATGKTEKGVQTEYAMVSYMRLESGKKALYFVSNNDIGVMATVNNFTKKEWLETFYKKLPANTEYFNALFEVSGLRRTEIDCELVEFEVVN